MKGRLPKSCSAMLGLVVLCGCVSPIETPEAAIEVAKRVCPNKLQVTKTPFAWTATLAGANWNVSGDAPPSVSVFAQVPQNGHGKPGCLVIIEAPGEVNLKDFQLP